MLGLELFARGRLSAEQRAALEQRGIFAAFRRLSKAEEEQFRKIDPDHTRSPDKPASQNKVYTSVPAEAK